MSSTINIQVPKQTASDWEPTKRAAEQGFVFTGPVNILSHALNEIDPFIDSLRIEGGLVPNSIILCTDKGIIIEIVDAKIDVTKQNTLTEVALINRSGKVKERIQANDYTVKVTGSLLAGQSRYPYEELVLLNQILNETRSINVANVYLYALGISKLVLKTADFKQSSLQGFNVIPFVLEFVSDKKYDFLEEDLAQTGST